MKINKFIAAILLVCTLLWNTSCHGFLDREPVTTVSPAELLSTEAGIEAAMIGVYAPMLNLRGWTGHMFGALQQASLLVGWNGNRLAGIDYAQKLDMVFTSNHVRNDDTFRILYQIIGHANTLIANLPYSPVDAAFRREIEAEATLVRALMYFTLVRLYGDVPLVLEPAGRGNDHLPRTSFIEIYRQILADLTFAETYMRSMERQQQATSGAGSRPHRGAAVALRAKVYTEMASIWRYAETPENNPFSSMPDFTSLGFANDSEVWRRALETSRRVINDPSFQLSPHFGHLFNWGFDPDAPGQFNPALVQRDFFNREGIWVIPVTDHGSRATIYINTRSIAPMRAWTNAGDNGRIRVSRFVFQRWASLSGATRFEGSYNGTPIPANWHLYQGNSQDPRFDLTFYHTNVYQRRAATVPFGATATTHPGGVNVLPVYPNPTFPVGTILLSHNDASSDLPAVPSPGFHNVANSHAPFFRKWSEPRAALIAGNAANGNLNFYILRLADIYLLAAEAAAELSNGPGDAYWTAAMNYMEVIHRRARFSTPDGTEAPLPRWTANQFGSQQDLLDAIFWERIFELYGEGHEWYEVRRKGSAFWARNVIEPLNAFLALPENNHNHVMGYRRNMFGDRTFPTTPEQLRYRRLHPFPNQEIARNNALTPADQNRFIVQ